MQASRLPMQPGRPHHKSTEQTNRNRPGRRNKIRTCPQRVQPGIPRLRAGEGARNEPGEGGGSRASAAFADPPHPQPLSRKRARGGLDKKKPPGQPVVLDEGQEEGEETAAGQMGR